VAGIRLVTTWTGGLPIDGGDRDHFGWSPRRREAANGWLMSR
jgi:hypothetical protein